MGNQNSVNEKKLSQEYLNSQSTHWMYCTKCYLIPVIKPFLMKGELYISLYCRCLYEEKEFMTFDEYIKSITVDDKNSKIKYYCKKHKSVEGFLFCISCEKWLCDFCFLSHKEIYPKHLYNKIPIRLKEYCHRHEKEEAVAYCINCHKNVCVNCKIAKLKIRHDIFDFDDPEKISDCNKKWNLFTETHISNSTNNEKSKEEVIKLINNCKDISDEKKKKVINKINNAFLKNKKINDKLCEFILFLYSNFDYSYHIGNIVNYNILNNINNIIIEKRKFSIKPQETPVKNAQRLLNYYENIYIIQLSPLVNIKNLTSDRENATKQISKICLLDENNAVTLTSKGIIIVWNYITYNELYRIKKVTVNEKEYLAKKDNNNNFNFSNNMNNLQNFIFDDDEDEDDLNNINERIIRQQEHILNLIQNNNNNFNDKKTEKTINLLKVFKINNYSKLNISNDMYNQNENNNNILNEEEEEGLELNYTIKSMAYIKQKNILCIIIDNCKDIYLFDLKKKETLKNKLIGHKNQVLDILTLKNDNLASYGEDFALKIWNMKRLQNIITIHVEIKKYYIYFTQLLYGNLIFATGESNIKIFKLPECEYDKEITSVPQPMNYFELPNKLLIISSDDFYVRVLKPPDYKVIAFFLNRKRTKIYSFLLLDKKRLLVGLEDCSIKIIYLNHKTPKNGNKINTHYSPISSLVKANENRVISISWDNVVKIFLVGD